MVFGKSEGPGLQGPPKPLHRLPSQDTHNVQVGIQAGPLPSAFSAAGENQEEAEHGGDPGED